MKLLYLLLMYISVALIAQQTAPSLDQIFLENKYRLPMPHDLIFVREGAAYVELTPDKLLYHDTKTGKRIDSIVFALSLGQVQDFVYNEKKHKLMLLYDIKPIYRRSTSCTIKMYDLVSHSLISLADGERVVNPELSATASYVTYVINNDLFYYDIAGQQQIRVTVDGSKTKVINGLADWAYEEEFSITKTYWWNADATKLAYLRFDETDVKTYVMPIYKQGSYPELYEYKYPKAGESSARVSLWIYNVGTRTHEQVDSSGEGYLPRAGWAENNQLFYYVINRLQNKLEIKIHKHSSHTTLYTEQSDTYLDIEENLVYGHKFLYFISDKSGYRHLYRLNMVSKDVQALTEGPWDVLEVHGITKGHVYFTHTKYSPHIHTLSYISLKTMQQVDYNKTGSASLLSMSSTHILVSSSALLVPTYYTLLSSNFKNIRVLDDYKSTIPSFAFLNDIKVDFMDIPASGYDISTLVLRSKLADNKTINRILIYQYSGPGYQQVVDEWKGNTMCWFAHLISKGYVIVLVDPRGTGGKGSEFKKCTYLQLGIKESEDMSLVSRHLSNQAFVDPKHISIFGWSFGGYVAALCASKWSPYFNKAVAVAPVTDWRYYDNIYTERYMRTPVTNARGYDTSAVTHYCHQMDTKLMLLHGTADDNVHLQHALQLQKCLLDANKQFDFFVFGDKNHSIAGKNTRYYLYTKVTDFLLSP